ncbi:hypothetical protein E4U19_003679 [Claviceps sp. Clav32 group G5]|nr:hypothetical protein E4U19_003679 [Claviceps sp. Clav32 group G5]
MNFYELIHCGGISENLKEEFYKKLPQEFRSHLFGDYRDKGVTLAQQADAAAKYEPISSWTRARAKTENGRAPGTTSAATAPKKAQPANPAPRQLPPDLQKLKELGRQDYLTNLRHDTLGSCGFLLCIRSPRSVLLYLHMPSRDIPSTDLLVLLAKTEGEGLGDKVPLNDPAPAKRSHLMSRMAHGRVTPSEAWA